MEFHFMRPEWLWCLLPAALLALLLWGQGRRAGNWNAVIDPELLPYLVQSKGSAKQRNWTPWIFTAWVIAALAAAGPSWEKIPQPVHQKQDALVLLLDLSYSMKSGDLAPSRVDRARQKLLDLLELRREGQTALIAYAGDAHIVTPLTDDTPTIANLLPALSPDMMPLPGSDPVAAVEQALALLRSAGIRRGDILLVSDGVDDDDVKAIGELMRESAARLSVLGVGTTTGAPIPLPRGGFVKDSSGAIVMPGLKADILRRLARENDGRYRSMQIDESDLDTLLAPTTLADNEETRLLDRSADSWDDKGYLLVLTLLPAALLLFRRGVMLCLLPAALLLPTSEASAQSWDDLWLTPDQQGQRALQSGDTERAAELFRQRDWAGLAAYESGEYARAADHFAAGDSADAWYNRGNALAREGKLDEAIAAYEESLERQPDQKDALDNLDLLKQLQEQQQQQNQNNQGGQQQDEQQQGEDGEQEQSQQNQSAQNGKGDQQPEQHNQSAQSDASEQEQQQGQSDPEGENPEQQGQDSQRQNAQNGEQPQEQAPAPETPSPLPPEQNTDEKQAAQMAQTDPEQAERDQAMEQWLRRVPDDPSGLLRQKFLYESKRRQQEGKRSDSDVFW